MKIAITILVGILQLIALPMVSPPIGDNYINEGNKAYKKGDYAKAMQCYSRAKRACEEKDKALNNQAVVLAQYGKHKLGIQKLEGAIQIDNTNPTYYYNAGLHHLQDDNLEEAINHFTEAEGLGLTRISDIDYNMALAYHKMGDTHKAISILESSSNVQDERHAYLLGFLHFSQKEYPAASDAFHLAYQTNKNSTNKYAAALASHYAGIDDTSLMDLTDNIKDKKEGSNLYTALGNIAIKNQDTEEGYACFKKALDYSKRNPNAWSGLGVILLDNGQTKEAHNYFAKALAMDKQNMQALHGMAAIKTKENKLDKANQYYNKILQLDSLNAPALYGMACGYIQLGDPYKCINHVEKINKNTLQGETLDQVVLLHCYALSRVNKINVSVEIMHQYISQFTDHELGLTHLSYFYLKMGKYKKVISTVGWNTFTTELPYLFAGNAALKTSDHSTAYKYFKKAYAINKDNVDILNGMAMSMVQTYRRNDAKDLIDSLYTTYPENFYVANAKGIIYKDIAIQIIGDGYSNSDRANTFLQESDNAFQHAKKLRPNLGQALNNNRGLSLMYQKKYDDARNLFNTCDMPASKSNKALIDINLGNYNSAAKQLSTILEEYKKATNKTIPYIEHNLSLARSRRSMNNNYTFITFYFLHEDRPTVPNGNPFSLEQIPGLSLEAKPILNYILETSAGQCEELKFISRKKKIKSAKSPKFRKPYAGKCPKF